MKYPLPSSTYSFNAGAGTITFTGTVPAEISSILQITNITRGVLLFQPQAGPSFTASYATPVLTLAASTAGHSNSDKLLIIYDDGVTSLAAGAATSSNQATSNTLLTSLDTKVPALSNGNVPVAPNITRGSGVSDTNTTRVALATDSGVLTTLTSLDSKTLTPINGRHPVDGSGVTQPISATALPLPAGAATETTLSAVNAKLPPLISGRQPVDGSGVTQPISATALPLPAGAATETTLSAVNAKLPALVAGAVPVSIATPVLASTVASTTSSATTLYSVNSLATTNAANIKASGANLYGLSVMNTSNATRYIRLYNLATAPVVGTSVPIIVVAVPATSSKEVQYTPALRFATGLAVSITSGAPVLNTGVVVAGDVQLTISYA